MPDFNYSKQKDTYLESFTPDSSKSIKPPIPLQKSSNGRNKHLRDLTSLEKEVRSLKLNFYQEHVILLVLDVDLKLLNKEILFIGGQSSAEVDFKILFKRVLRVKKSAGFVIAHNHTSEYLTPSFNDLQITQELKKASKLLDLFFMDHLIFNEKEALSLRDLGWFDK